MTVASLAIRSRSVFGLLPVLEPQQQNIQAVLVGSQQARWVQQLLEDLIERRKLDFGLNFQLPQPMAQRLRYRLGCKGAGDAQHRLDLPLVLSGSAAFYE